MEGVIVNINKRRGMVAVDVSGGIHSVFEMLSDTNFAVGDKVSWTYDTVLGDSKITNHTKGEVAEVYFQNHHVSRQNLAKSMLY